MIGYYTIILADNTYNVIFTEWFMLWKQISVQSTDTKHKHSDVAAATALVYKTLHTF